VAPKGKLLSEPEKQLYRLLLHNGSIYQVDLKERSANFIDFETYEMRLVIKRETTTSSPRDKHRKEMSLTELQRYLDNSTNRDAGYYSVLMELHKKFSLPFACLALGLLAVPLGIQSKSAKRSMGLSLGLVCFLLYYLLLSVGRVFGETGAYPPVIGMWVPNIAMGGLGLFLLIRNAKERPVEIFSLLRWFQRGLEILVTKKTKIK
jgi:lipopolysaccharide export system permease protein